jgi:hypothetical protein
VEAQTTDPFGVASFEKIISADIPELTFDIKTGT